MHRHCRLPRGWRIVPPVRLRPPYRAGRLTSGIADPRSPLGHLRPSVLIDDGDDAAMAGVDVDSSMVTRQVFPDSIVRLTAGGTPITKDPVRGTPSAFKWDVPGLGSFEVNDSRASLQVTFDGGSDGGSTINSTSLAATFAHRTPWSPTVRCRGRHPEPMPCCVFDARFNRRQPVLAARPSGLVGLGFGDFRGAHRSDML